jgi:thiol-disulfide isomerase/thioredoxin
MVTIFGILAAIAAAIHVSPRAGVGMVHAAERSLPPAPAFALPDLDGRTRTLQEFLGARPVLLEFMSTDCPHCRYMGSVVARLHAVYGDRASFLTVAFDRLRGAGEGPGGGTAGAVTSKQGEGPDVPGELLQRGPAGWRVEGRGGMDGWVRNGVT